MDERWQSKDVVMQVRSTCVEFTALQRNWGLGLFKEHQFLAKIQNKNSEVRT